MITLRPAKERGHFNFGWLDTSHSFSFGDYQDPAHEQFRALRVLNEDRVEPGQGFGTHGHRDMEILTWVLSGALAHEDSTGGRHALPPGTAQRMTAGRGIRHSEFNGSDTEPVHFLQIWVLPERAGLAPGYEEKAFPLEDRRSRLTLLASRGGREGSLHWNQDVDLWTAVLEPGTERSLALRPGRAAWVQVASGAVDLDGVALAAGDGAAVTGETGLRLLGGEAGGEVMVFDLA
ncbi:pirin family protein [Mesoterricola silvestris]|uniref:Quercetin 2,3-dioxygenase n=1 Tax=Mesoterricola silvestris TaxID=2927979 RepID=A0AA48GJ79_9BACT|nr:pirin family protein [Mesoterricola silvestris]BDU72099.1 quercetin 2,3-dioxygenase [Mesoterricola silvestris]